MGHQNHLRETGDEIFQFFFISGNFSAEIRLVSIVEVCHSNCDSSAGGCCRIIKLGHQESASRSVRLASNVSGTCFPQVAGLLFPVSCDHESCETWDSHVFLFADVCAADMKATSDEFGTSKLSCAPCPHHDNMVHHQRCSRTFQARLPLH